MPRAIDSASMLSYLRDPIPVSKSVCEDNNGVWYGAGCDVSGVPSAGLARCCDAVAFIVASGQPPPTRSRG